MGALVGGRENELFTFLDFPKSKFCNRHIYLPSPCIGIESQDLSIFRGEAVQSSGEKSYPNQIKKQSLGTTTAAGSADCPPPPPPPPYPPPESTTRRPTSARDCPPPPPSYPPPNKTGRPTSARDCSPPPPPYAPPNNPIMPRYAEAVTVAGLREALRRLRGALPVQFWECFRANVGWYGQEARARSLITYLKQIWPDWNTGAGALKFMSGFGAIKAHSGIRDSASWDRSGQHYFDPGNQVYSYILAKTWPGCLPGVTNQKTLGDLWNSQGASTVEVDVELRLCL